jgi:hypothetical protein
MRKELTTTSENKPAFLKGIEVDDSLLQADIKDVRISGLSLCQGKHPAIKMDVAKEGDYVDTVTNKNYGKTVDIIVLKHEKVWILKEEQEFKSVSKDGENWDTGESLTKEENFQCLNHNFLVLVADDIQPLPMNLNFKGFSKNAAQNLVNLLYRSMKVNLEPMHSHIYTIGSESMTHKKNDFLVKTVQPKGYVTKEQFEFAEKVSKSLKEVTIKVENEVEETVETKGGENIEID